MYFNKLYNIHRKEKENHDFFRCEIKSLFDEIPEVIKLFHHKSAKLTFMCMRCRSLYHSQTTALVLCPNLIRRKKTSYDDVIHQNIIIGCRDIPFAFRSYAIAIQTQWSIQNTSHFVRSFDISVNFLIHSSIHTMANILSRQKLIRKIEMSNAHSINWFFGLGRCYHHKINECIYRNYCYACQMH